MKTLLICVELLSHSFSLSGGNAAAMHGGGWWYVNGRYFHPTQNNFTTSVEVNSYYYRMRATHFKLMIRPQLCDSPVKTIHLREKLCVKCSQ